MSRVIDAHQHFWTAPAPNWRGASHPALARAFGPDDLVPELRAAKIDATILVQSADNPAENDRLKAYAQSELVAGVVAWLPLSDPESAIAELDRITHWKKFCGVRAIISDDPLEWLSSKGIIATFQEIARRGLTWDVVVVSSMQLAAVLKLAAAVPELRIVVGHLGRPPLESVGWQPWATDIGRLANYPNVALKISIGVDVLLSWERWQAIDIVPYVRWAGEMLGSARIMLASNWPVALMKTNYQQTWRDLSTAVEMTFSDPDDLRRVKGETALRWYGQMPIRAKSP
ncbi:amidohydrolase family protein [Arthrobacter pigmenti]